MMHHSGFWTGAVLDPDFDFMFGAREGVDFSFQEEPYRGPYNHNASVNGPTVRGTQVNEAPAIWRTVTMRGRNQ